ncbi:MULTISPECIES: hypothetical protein [Cupriavidus]
MELLYKVFGSDNEFFDKTGKPVYMNEKYFKSLHYKFINERERSRKRKDRCIMPNCNGKCVSSHTIPESSVLKKISHAGNVLYPKYNSDLNIYECTSISTGKASAFPGFCIEHEDIFSGFERSGNFLDPSIATQNLRVIFRYLFQWKSLHRVFENSLLSYKKEIESYNLEKINLINSKHKKNIKLLSVNDDIVEHMKNQINIIKYHIWKIEQEDLNPFISTMSGDEDSVSVLAIQMKLPLPICLAGKSEFQDGIGKYTVHLSIFPQLESTFCLFSLNKNSEERFKKILDRYNNDFEFLNFIESWMIYGTDFWYINPTEWNQYSEEKKTKILAEIQSIDHFPDEDLGFTIFDSLRAHRS